MERQVCETPLLSVEKVFSGINKICLSSLTFVLLTNGRVPINADMFDSGSE